MNKIVNLTERRLKDLAYKMRILVHPPRFILSTTDNPSCYHLIPECPSLGKASNPISIKPEELRLLSAIGGRQIPICSQCERARDLALQDLERDRDRIVELLEDNGVVLVDPTLPEE